MKRFTLICLLLCLANASASARTAEEAWSSLLLPKNAGRAEFSFVRNDPQLPNILIYGDSISIQYMQHLRQQLGGKANVYRIHQNGGDSSSFIPKMESMHKVMRDPELDNHWSFDWDVIQFNVGLHDLKYVVGGKLDRQNGQQVNSFADYENNLRSIIAYLAQTSPDAKLIFATTTPVPEGEAGRIAGDAARYNQVALKVLQNYPDIVVNDLYALTLPNHSKWWSKPGNVHFNDTGRIAQGDRVAQVILDTLEGSAIHVSPDGNDRASGTRSDPLKTLAKAVKKAAAGEAVILLGGRYAEPMSLKNVSGTAEQPLVIRTAPGERVVFDGTDMLPARWHEVTRDSAPGQMIQAAQWERIGGNKVFSLKLDKPIYALVYDGRLMSDARWPNARWDDPWRLDRYNVLRRATEDSTPGELHDGFPTENTLEGCSRWVHYDREARVPYREMLAETGLDFTDSVVLMSYAWGSWGTRVLEHEAGSDHFRFDNKFKGSGSLQEEAVRFIVNRIHWDDENRFKRSSHGGIHYFMLGLPALDIPEEWWYDADSKTLFFMPPDGKKPAAGKVRGKRRDYLLTLENSSYVHLKGFEFLGAAARIEDSTHSRLEDCNFVFSSYHKFSVGNFDMPVTTRIANKGGDADKPFGNALVNCQFSYLDGNAFEGRSMGLEINNLRVFRTQQTTLGLDSRSISINDPSLLRRVSIADVGASVGIKGGKAAGLYILNDICCFGGLQYDGAALQMGGRERYRYLYNWSHDHPKRSYRFDAATNPGYTNAFGEIAYNLAWNTPGGMAIKGDDHLIHNNLMLGDSKIELFNMKRWASKNERTVVANNVVQRFVAGTDDWSGIQPPPKAKVLSIMHNNVTEDVGVYLRDPANLDFRPRKGSPLVDAGYRLNADEVPWKETPLVGMDSFVGEGPDIGAYEYGAEGYWIPGFQFAHASRPIPPDGTVTAKPDADLMWLGAYKAVSHLVYFGGDRATVENAGVDSTEFRGVYAGTVNIHELASLESGKTYHWRVDAVRDGKTAKGKTWGFTVQ